MKHDTASRNRKTKGGREMSEDEVFESYHLSLVPDMPITGSGHGHKGTFRSPVVRPRSVSSPASLVPRPLSFDLTGIPTLKHQGRIQTVRQRGGQRQALDLEE